jgi:sugar (pentulose or hexulose) kinase
MPDLYLGLDIGTSGARALVMSDKGTVVASAKSAMSDHGANHRDPMVWWAAAQTALQRALADCPAKNIRAVAVDGTSGTMLACDRALTPLGDGVMYNDPCNDQGLIARIAAASPPQTAARGATSALARAVALHQAHQGVTGLQILHQADWIVAKLAGIVASDANNALKTGYDPVAGAWPDWVSGFLPLDLLPTIHDAGTDLGAIGANDLGLSPDTRLVAGTTDGCASYLATGADQAGDGVSVLGTTLTLKILSDQPIFAPEFGIYSHKVLGLWLAGGASNTGGAVILQEFPDQDIAQLSQQIDPAAPTGLDYYPLTQKGERFPINDPELPPRLGPRPAQDWRHLQAIFEGIAAIECRAYRRLAELGAPALSTIRSLGGGAQDQAFTTIRLNSLGVQPRKPLSGEAAMGAAILAQKGMRR